MTNPIATRVDDDLAKEVERVASETGLKASDLLRIGLKRIVKDYNETGSITLGTKSAPTAAKLN